MDWGIAQGYIGLAATSNKRESAKEELATLSMLDQQMKSDRAEKEQAELKEQAYYAEVSKFADTLLAPDRNRINEKSKLLSSMVREHVKANGGDMTKFFSNGGHKVLSDYKAAILGSEESSTYIDNKKNMEQIIDMQKKGFGHLINQNDMWNMQNYQATGKGKITYTGMLSEIKLPPTENYDWGQEIPAADILNFDQNYVKFLGNYKTTYPDAPPPTPQELERFVSSQHGGVKGSNYNRKMSIEKEQFDQTMRLDTLQFQKEDAAEKNRQSWFQLNLQSENQAFNQEVKLKELEQTDTELQAKYGVSTPEEAKAAKEAEDSWAFDVQNMETTLSYDVPTVNDINDSKMDKFASYFGFDKLLKYEDSAEDFAAQGSGGFLEGSNFVSKGIKEMGATGYKIRGSKMFINGNLATNAIKEAGLFEFNDKGFIDGINISQNRDMFDASGTKADNWASYGVNDKGFATNTYAEDLMAKKFKVKGVVGGFIGSDKQGNEIMIMDVATGAGSRTTDKKKTEKYNERNLDTTKKPSFGMFVALQSEDGHTMYKRIEGNQTMTLMQKWAGANTGVVKNARKHGDAAANNVRFADQQSKADVQNVYNYLNTQPNITQRIIQQSRMIPGAGTSGGKFAPLVTSYYTALTAMAGGDIRAIDKTVNDGSFHAIIQDIQKDATKSKQFTELINNPRTDQRAIIDYFQRAGYISQPNAQQWKSTLEYVTLKK